MIDDLLVVISDEEFRLRLSRIKETMKNMGLTNALIASNANLYYLTGRVYSGYALITLDHDPVFFVKRPVNLQGLNVVRIHKPENILQSLTDLGITLDGTLGLELNRIPYSTVIRLQKALGASSLTDAGSVMAVARAVKTPRQIELLKESGIRHAAVYRRIPDLFRDDMSDVELQIEIERALRMEGCLGQFRISGDDMELFMGSLLVGDNADAPSPYDFAMGGAGMDFSLPVGANGTLIHPGMTVMVDMCGNFTGYMTDMTRTFRCGEIKPEATDAHKLSIDICHELQRIGTAGTEAKALYEVAADMAKAAGLEHLFMGHRQHAGFVGHGIGIEVNELPVISPKSRDILQPGNVIAIEPKFVIPGTGAVGIENSYVVRESGEMECITNCPEELIEF